MSAARSVLVWALVGALVGVVVASFVVPPLLSWYNEPGKISSQGQVQTLCNLPELIRYTSSRLIRGQLIGAGVGAVLFALLGLMVRGRPAAATPPLPPAHA